MENFGFAIVMTGSKSPFVLNGAFSDGILFIDSKDHLPAGSKLDLIGELLEIKLDKKAKRGLKVIVSEASPDISKAIGGHHRTINDRTVNDEPIVGVAIPSYEELFNAGCIVVSDEGGLSLAQFTLPSSSYQIDYNLQGDAFYRVEWTSISEDVKAVLLAVYSSTYHAVDTASYLKDVCGIVSAEPAVHSDVRGIMDTLAEYDNKKTEAIREAGGGSLTGGIYKGNPRDRIL